MSGDENDGLTSYKRPLSHQKRVFEHQQRCHLFKKYKSATQECYIKELLCRAHKIKNQGRGIAPLTY